MNYQLSKVLQSTVLNNNNNKIQKNSAKWKPVASFPAGNVNETPGKLHISTIRVVAKKI